MLEKRFANYRPRVQPVCESVRTVRQDRNVSCEVTYVGDYTKLPWPGHLWLLTKIQMLGILPSLKDRERDIVSFPNFEGAHVGIDVWWWWGGDGLMVFIVMMAGDER